ncbi:hypothetical protein FJTKL_04268 [Diaporthe vaccinii]|uniref:Uncharacterized protein n=1 Tax=Diaporthe vaccinii TaxID=105482 RepID=A0ABR4F0W1_9PEZI
MAGSGVLATCNWTGRVQNIHLPNTITAATTGASLLSSYPHTPPFSCTQIPAAKPPLLGIYITQPPPSHTFPLPVH